jgi:hypothetical protein
MTVPTPRETEPGGHDEAIKEVERLRDQVAALKASIANADVASSGEAPALPSLEEMTMLIYEARPTNIWVGHGVEAMLEHCQAWAERIVRARLASPPQEERPT